MKAQDEPDFELTKILTAHELHGQQAITVERYKGVYYLAYNATPTTSTQSKTESMPAALWHQR